MDIAVEKALWAPPKPGGLKNNTAQLHTGSVRRWVWALSVPKLLTSSTGHLVSQRSLKHPLSPPEEKGPNPTIRDARFVVVCVLSVASVIFCLENCIPG